VLAVLPDRASFHPRNIKARSRLPSIFLTITKRDRASEISVIIRQVLNESDILRYDRNDSGLTLLC
jgi:hypothetical protein